MLVNSLYTAAKPANVTRRTVFYDPLYRREPSQKANTIYITNCTL